MRVYDVITGQVVDVSRPEARAGVLRYARSLGPGSPACAEMERRALEISSNENGA